MKKIFLFLSIVFASNYLQANELIKHIKAVKYGQFYCLRGSESAELKDFLKNHAKYAYNECKHEKYNKEDFSKLEKLANKNPKEYAYFLAMTYYLGWTPDFKMNDKKASEWFLKSASFGNVESQINYCNLKDVKSDRIKCYDKLDSPSSYLARAVYVYNNDRDIRDKNIKTSAIEGNMEAYPAYISNESGRHEDFKLNKSIIQRLDKIILNSKTSFDAKVISSQILNNDKYLSLLSILLKPSDFEYHN